MSIWDNLLVYRMGCYYMGWDVRLEDGVFVYRWGVSVRDGVFVYTMRC